MEPLDQGTNLIENMFNSFWNNLMNILPGILGAILLIIVGWGIAKIISTALRKILQSIHVDSLGQKIFSRTSIKIEEERIKPSRWISIFVYWFILLLFFISASDTLGWAGVSESIRNLANYLPHLLGAILIFALGLYIGSFLRGLVRTTSDSLGLSAGTILGEATFYFIMILAATTALEQAGIETTIITSNISIIIGGVLLAFALGFGFSSRDLLTNTLSSFYAKHTFQEGQTIRIDNVEGIIQQIDNIQTIIKTETGELIIPNKRLISESIERLDTKEVVKKKKKKQKQEVPAG
ncbi:MAG: mechanosensitive ion channel [Balneolaceae bacterium]|jgi:hypothetical protein